MVKVMIKKLVLIIVIFLITKNSWAVDQEILLKTNQDWAKQDLIYPTPQTETTFLRIKIAPGEVIPYHCHQVALFGYVLSGSVQVETMGGKKHLFKKGDVFAEVQKTWHLGFNPSKTKDTEILLSYIGKKGVDNAIVYNESNKDKCHL